MKKTKTSKINDLIPKASGFTLIETLVAISVLLISILAPLQIASQALFSSFYSRDEITAYYLAAEAIEYIRNTRDSTDLTGLNNTPRPYWLKDLDSCNTSKNAQGCMIDTRLPLTNAFSICPPTGCTPLLFDSASGIWNYDNSIQTNTVSRFKRTVELIPHNNHGNDGEALIKVTVEWTGNGTFGGAKKVTLNGYMTDWQTR